MRLHEFFLLSTNWRASMTRRENCEDKMDQFLKRCFYHAGQYNSEEDFAELNSKMIEKEVMRTRSFSLVCLI